jgi:hypothetical protein
LKGVEEEKRGARAFNGGWCQRREKNSNDSVLVLVLVLVLVGAMKGKKE